MKKIKEIFWIDLKNGRLSIFLFFTILVTLYLTLVGVIYHQQTHKQVNKVENCGTNKR